MYKLSRIYLIVICGWLALCLSIYGLGLESTGSMLHGSVCFLVDQVAVSFSDSILLSISIS